MTNLENLKIIGISGPSLEVDEINSYISKFPNTVEYLFIDAYPFPNITSDKMKIIKADRPNGI